MKVQSALWRTSLLPLVPLVFEFGPPVPVKPAHELYGEVLLAEGRAPAARKEFERALERCPGRKLSLRGLAQTK